MALLPDLLPSLPLQVLLSPPFLFILFFVFVLHSVTILQFLCVFVLRSSSPLSRLSTAGYVGIGSSMIIGVVGGLLSHWSCHVIRERLRIDDALEVSSVHGISSIVGTLSVGLFAYRGIKSGPAMPYTTRHAASHTPRVGAGLADGRGLFFGGGFELFFIQLMAILVSAAWSVGVTWIIIEGLQRAGLQLRPPEGHEEHGIDFVSHGER